MMEKFLRRLNLNLILAVFLAVVLWLFVTGDNITRTTPVRKIIHGVPLSYENLEPGLAVVKMPQTVNMTLEGLPHAFDELEESELEAYLDLTAIEAGTHQVQVRGKAPRGLILISLEPQQVEVSIEELHSKLFPVEVEFLGQPAAGWIRQSHSCQPLQLRLEAVPSVLEQVARVVVYVDLSGRSDRFETEITPLLLNAFDEEVAGVTVEPPKVTVMVHFVEESNGASTLP
ncbi:MAG: CdaR family protein [Dethiobacteria bacterium]|jgi:YbbR domain-containing protein|nr:CdaR family protein [Bacillota bacterium]